MLVRGVMYDRRFLFDLPIAKIGCHLVQSDFLPQAVFGHDLVELLELAKAGEGVIPKRGHLDVRDSQNYQGFVDCSGILVARTPECGIVRCTRIVELPRKLAVFEC